MKSVALVLLLANLALFGWLYTHPQQQQADAGRATSQPASVEPLVLLRERTKSVVPGHAIPSRPVQAPAAPIPEAGVLVQAPEQFGTAQDAMPAAPESTNQAAPPGAQDMTQQPAVAPAASSNAAEHVSEPVPVRLCQTIGPFPVRAEVDAFLDELTALGRAAAIRVAQIEQPSGYWVYLPSMPQAEAERTIVDLEAKGVNDYFLGRQNFISLGVFTDKRSAETRVRDITALGYAPHLEPRFLTREVFWIDLEEDSSQRLDELHWDELLTNRPALRRQTVACE